MRPIHAIGFALVCSGAALVACNVVLGLDDLKDQVDSGAMDTGVGEGGDGAADAAPNCADYCASVSKLCGFGDPQYLDQKTCLAMCATFPIGDDLNLKDNTLVCRWGNLKPDASCASAGPYASSCGGEANNFCALYEAACGDAGEYGVSCPNTFGALPYALDAAVSFLPENHGPTRTCREYFLELAYQSGGGLYCVEASKSSAPYACK